MSNNPTRPVLVVEDEVFIRMVAVDSLEDRGYSILEAGDADEALVLLENTPGVALVFTDINMPGSTDGLDLATEIAKRWPNIEIIVTSGGMRLDDGDIPDAGRFLPKPYTSEQLGRMVKEQLTRHSDGM
jgi:CheY-like chemotaxis protein